jgi:NAD(P)-dependent dehydrogenase (short-subunit alcohol dehydrogenase family)
MTTDMNASPPRVAVITGASQGIGAGLVAGYRSLGYAVVATSRSIESSEDPMILTVRADVGQRGAGEAVIGAAVRRFGRVDTLVNNAGLFVGKPFADCSYEDFERVMAVNLRGFFEMTQHALAAMTPRGAGHVLSITTTLVEQADARVPAALAALTKGGVAAATKSLAIEYAAAGIRVNAISPGVIKTPMYAPEDYAALAGLHPMRRAGEIDDVVRGALYLESAPFVTGEFLHVDGGQSAGH